VLRGGGRCFCASTRSYFQVATELSSAAAAQIFIKIRQLPCGFFKKLTQRYLHWAFTFWGLKFMRGILRKFIANEDGATAIEYGLIAALIALFIITALTSIGTNLNTDFTSVASSLR
jgi:pilus assembly protein Flp/PilA